MMPSCLTWFASMKNRLLEITAKSALSHPFHYYSLDSTATADISFEGEGLTHRQILVAPLGPPFPLPSPLHHPRLVLVPKGRAVIDTVKP